MGERRDLSAEYAVLNQLAGELRRRMDLLNTAISELTVARSALGELRKLSGGEEVLVPIGGNVMIRAQFLKTERVLVGVGSGVMVEKSFEEAESYLAERERRLREELQRVASEYQKVLARMSEIERQLASTGTG